MSSEESNGVASGHTPGPWRVGRTGHIIGQRVSPVAFACFGGEFLSASGEAEANAHLIAAAPALYEALKEACEVIKDLSRYANNNGAMIDDETFAKGLAALAQARGEPQ